MQFELDPGGGGRARIGVANDCFYYSPRADDALKAGLPSARFVDVDLLVNSAGALPRGRLADVPASRLRPAFEATVTCFLHSVIDAVREGLELGSLRKENRQLRSALDARYQLVGASPALKTIMDQVRRAAPTTATVLILGETGTGKEVIARTIRAYSSRAGNMFVPFNCSATPKDMLDAQLFGHRRGAFTGASEHLPGIIRGA